MMQKKITCRTYVVGKGESADSQHFHLVPQNFLSRILASLKQKAFKDIIGKRESAHTKHFLLFLHCLCPLTLYYTVLTFNDLEKGSHLKTLWEKEKMLVTSIFSFSYKVFCSIKDRNHHFSNIETVVCKCFEFSLVKYTTQNLLRITFF